MAEERTASFKVYFDVPRFRIAYKNKTDLFEAFQKKLKELNLDIDNITWADWDGDRSLVNTPDDLFGAAEDYSAGAYSLVKLFYRINYDQESANCSSSEEEEEGQKENEKNEELLVEQCRSPSRSCYCRR
ncbi:unnamed protein product [Cylicostephanus goldi]|uniref:PB1 domain-containing protein n=1 Tax=Cylicostephanus goldi TaxID=71465 RepID=A0A3P6SK45_CYLGO|nr:unnamed protein product [Cylicostephanus goldi]